MHRTQIGSTSLFSAVAGIHLFTLLPAIGDETADNSAGYAADCKAAETRYLENDFPNSEDAERFFECFRVDFTYGSITRVITPELPEHDEHCHREGKGLATDCDELSRG